MCHDRTLYILCLKCRNERSPHWWRGQGPGWLVLVNHRRGTQFERSLMETSSAQCHYHLSTRISSSSNNIYKPNILINLDLVLVVYITFYNVSLVGFTMHSLHHWRAWLHDMTTELWQMTYPCHRVFMNDVKSEYNHHSRVRMWWWVTVSSAGAGWRLSAGTGPGLLLVTVCLHTAVWSSHLSDTLQQICKQGFTMSRI